MQENAQHAGNAATLCKKNAQHAGDAATLCTKLRRQRTKSKGKSETSRDRESRFFENANSRNAILKRQTADGESRTQGGGQPSVAENEWRWVVAKERGLR